MDLDKVLEVGSKIGVAICATAIMVAIVCACVLIVVLTYNAVGELL